MFENLKKIGSQLFMKKALFHIFRRGFNLGWCPICEKHTLFYKEGVWLRDQYFCIRCYSIPRARALIHVLQTHFPKWRELYIHESSPGLTSSIMIERECKNYIPTHYFPSIKEGEIKDGYRCEDLGHQTFADELFDLVITQDVFEHILEPEKAFAEIERTLKPGGSHLFTVPWYYWQETVIRAKSVGNEIKYLKDPIYHGNPIDSAGSLLVTEWGYDLFNFIYKSSGMTTTAIKITNRHMGIDAEFIEVFISRKPARK